MKRAGPALVGGIAGVLVCFVVAHLERRYGLGFLALFLAATAAVYAGSALADKQEGAGVIEALVFLGVFGLALAGMFSSARFIAAGYIAHGIWDFFHHPPRVGARVAAWFPPLCLVFDVVVAIFILYRF